MTVGTVAYAAPEQLMGDDIDGRADQYALAATTYHLLTGDPLFPHTNPAVVISKHLNAAAPALSVTRADLAVLDPILAAALAKRPEERFSSCVDFARAMTEAVAPHAVPVGAAPTQLSSLAHRSDVGGSKSDADTDAERGPVGAASRWLIGLAVAVVVLLGVVGLLWQPWQQRDSDTAGAAVSSSTAPTTSTVIPTTTSTPSAATPTPATAPPAPTTSAAQVNSGPKIVDACDDWMKFSTDSATGQEMICSGLPMAPTTWHSTASGIAAGLGDNPRVGPTGSPCNEPPYTFGRSSDGYAVWCYSGSQALMPGLQWLDTPDQRPVWALYSP